MALAQSKIPRLEIPFNRPASNFLSDISSNVSIPANASNCSQSLSEIDHLKEPNGCAPLSDHFEYLPFRPPSDVESCNSRPVSRVVRYSTSPGSSISSRQSVKISASDSEDYIPPGRYFADASKPTVKSVLKRRVQVIYPPSIENDPGQAPSESIDKVLHMLIEHIRDFKFPSELGFYTSTKGNLVLVNNDKNEPFIDQLRRLDALRTKLAGISTQNNEELNSKHAAVSEAIECAFQKMKVHQHKLYPQFIRVSESNTALENLRIEFENCVYSYEFPSGLDFPANAYNHLLLLDTDRNQGFNNQLRALDGIRKELVPIRTHGHEELEEKYKRLSIRIGQSIQELRKHQVKLYEKWKKAITPKSE